jgi:hypothetical protein
MKKTVLAFSILATMAVNSSAQTKTATPQRETSAPTKSATAAQKDVVKDPAQYAERISRDLQKKVNLSEEQYKQVLDINLRFVNESNAVRTSGNVDMTRIAELKKRRDDELKGVLNPGQFNQFMEERKAPKNANTKGEAATAPDAPVKDQAPVKPERKK